MDTSSLGLASRRSINSVANRVQTVFRWKRHARNGLEDRALSGRLITANDDLWQVDISADAFGTKSIDSIEEFPMIIGLEC